MTNIFLHFKISFESLSNFKVRTILAICGVVLGTLSIITVASISKSLALKTDIELDRFGKNLIIVKSDIRRGHRGTRIFSEKANLTLLDADLIMDSIPGVKMAIPVANKSFPLRFKGRSIDSTLVMGVTPEFFSIRGLNLTSGRFFNKSEDFSKKTIIGSKVLKELFYKTQPIGKNIFLYRVPFEVLGVIEPLGVDLANVDQDNMIYVPLKTFLRRLINDANVNLIYVQTYDSKLIPEVKNTIEEVLKKEHKIKEGQTNDFSIVDLKDISSMQIKTMSIVKTLGLITSCLSFIISSIGILSIMVLMVNERKIEIGIRRAVGATKTAIVLQFLMESSFISLLGAVIGLLSALLLTFAISFFASIPFAFSNEAIIIAFFASFFTGILSGIYPSKKAIEIQPVQVLRLG